MFDCRHSTLRGAQSWHRNFHILVLEQMHQAAVLRICSDGQMIRLKIDNQNRVIFCSLLVNNYNVFAWKLKTFSINGCSHVDIRLAGKVN